MYVELALPMPNLAILPLSEAYEGLRHTLLEDGLACAFPMRPKLPLNFAHVQLVARFLCRAVDIGIEQGRAAPFFRGLDLAGITGVALDELVRLYALGGLGDLEHQLVVEAAFADGRVFD